MDTKRNTFKKAQTGGSMDAAEFKQYRAGWRPDCGPFADPPGNGKAEIVEPELDFSPASDAAGLDGRGRDQGHGYAKIDFSKVPPRDLKRVKHLSKLRIGGKDTGPIGYGITDQIDRITGVGAGDAAHEVGVPDHPPTLWRPLCGPASTSVAG